MEDAAAKDDGQTAVLVENFHCDTTGAAECLAVILTMTRSSLLSLY